MKIILALIMLMVFSSLGFADDDFVFVKGGKFLMGSPSSENWRSDDELQHEVSLNDFHIARREVTQSEYQTLMND
ncbi:MAG: SUMF1/EgtB/PvdO family nonheme iron enzyme, partial [Synergistaceae bacterium]|nr:SUMF1/EgtB/PvdO family nonheme iron enzyme [Synergistaceae bacterium]